MTDTVSPTGVVGIVTDDNGRVIASESDFETAGYGGFTLVESQKVRVKRSLERAVINAYCSPIISKVLSDYELSSILNRLQTEHKYTVTYINVPEERK